MLLVRSLKSALALATAIALTTPSPLTAQKHDAGGAATYPAHILIIRHAEKPAEPSTSVALAPAGVARARKLHELFEASAGRAQPLPRPDFIFATRDTKQSHRPSLTAAPLGTSLGVPVDTRFGDKQVDRLAREILTHRRYAGKTILIVWHQGTIPDVAKALGAKDAPGSWKDSVFDRVWVISYGSNGRVSFEDRPQQLSAASGK